MKAWPFAAVAAVMTLSCTSNGTASPSPSASPVVAAVTSPAATPSPTAGPCTPTANYGLLITGGSLELINTCGKVAASAAVTPPSVQACSPGGVSANLEPPASATSDQVFYRDGDTKIRSMSLDGQTADVTTVPGGPTTVSFFSVSPDDQRIAVMVEDLSSASSIGLRLYVEDLHGGGHRADIYTTTQAKNGGTTLWPAGWHQGQLVLAVMTACSSDPSTLSPLEWHVADASTGNRTATITDKCVPGYPGALSRWPSAAGVVCLTNDAICSYNWTGQQTACWNSFTVACNSLGGLGSALSPVGDRLTVSTDIGPCGMRPYTRIWTVVPFGSVRDASGAACLWIDNLHLLAPDAIIGADPTTPNDRYPPPTASEVSLSARGACAGRFPGL